MKIKKIMAIFFVFLSVVPMFFLGIINVQYYNRHLELVLENDLKNTASIQKEAIENFLNERREDVAIITSLTMVTDLLNYSSAGDSSRAAKLRPILESSFLARMENSRFVESVTVIDKNYIIAASSETKAYGNKSILDAINPNLLKEELQFSSVLERKEAGSTIKEIVAMQEICSDGALIGYFVMEINLAFFERLRSASSMYNNGTIYLLDGEGSLIAAGDNYASREQFMLSQAERKGFDDAWENRDKNMSEGYLRYTAIGDRYLSYYCNIEDAGWKIISSVNVDQILEKENDYLEVLWLILLVVLFLLAGVNYFMNRYLGRPIENMVCKFQKINETRDYSIRMNQFGNSELNIIASEINHLLEGAEAYIQKEKKEREQLLDLAKRDSLTGVLNKRAMEQTIDFELKHAKESGTTAACIYVDIDEFKGYNTKYGHGGGDKVIQFVADTLKKHLGGEVGRLGGDEFMVCIPDIKNIDELTDLVSRTQKALCAGVFLEEAGEVVSVSSSIGIVVSDGGNSFEEVIARADEAMYMVKGGNKNGYYIWKQKNDLID